MVFLRSLVGAALGIFLSNAVWAETKTLNVAVLKFGTVNWELDTIAHHKFDVANGFSLQVQGVAGGSAAMVAFQGGTADVMVTDWLWVARQRAVGKDYVFIPYSKAVGGVMVGQTSTAQTVADLKGEKIGIAGGPLDKSWLILQAYAAQQFGLNLRDETEQVFGAPPLIFKSALSGETAAAINFWHFTAKMEAAGMRKLLDIADASRALGLDPDTPLLGYVVKGEMLRSEPELLRGFYNATRAAKDLLSQDDAEWNRLRPRMNAKTDAEFEGLKAGFRAGIPEDAPIDIAAADRMLKLMAELGGERLLGKATTLPDGVFLTVEE
jgi:NitT/TauT family transport system substrate-binding protein